MEVEIFKFDHFGRGIGKINNKVIFVDKALPGEKVCVFITKDKKNYCEGRINEIKKVSKERIDTICPLYEKCGGCNFLHTTYDNEKKFKINKAIELLGRCDNFYETDNLNYRNKVTLHVNDGKIGFFKESSHEIVMVDYCYLLDEKINRVISDLRMISIDDYDIKKIIIKVNQDKVLLNVDNDVDDFFLDYFSYVDTVIANNKVIKGNGYLEEVIDNKKFKITTEAFFQVNKQGLLNINRIINRYLKDKKINKALDLYCGTGLWGILISDYVNEITGIEINSEACNNANDNIKNNNISNVKIINGDVKDYINDFSDIDLVITDPPRSGLDNKTIDYLKKIKSKYFIYISCDMYTLKRDLKDLEDIYEIKEINLVDMFKRTYHCESICLLERIY